MKSFILSITSFEKMKFKTAKGFFKFLLLLIFNPDISISIVMEVLYSFIKSYKDKLFQQSASIKTLKINCLSFISYLS